MIKPKYPPKPEDLVDPNEPRREKLYKKTDKHAKRLVQELGVAVRAMREEAGLTQGQLAKKCGMSHGSLNKIETGIQNRRPKFEFVAHIAQVLGRELRITLAKEDTKGDVVSAPGLDLTKYKRREPVNSHGEPLFK